MEAFLAWYASVLTWLQLNWERIPPTARTIINVCMGAGIAAVAQTWVSGQTDIKTLWTAFYIAFGTALWRILNPADTSRGWRAGNNVVGPSAEKPVEEAPELGDTTTTASLDVADSDPGVNE